MRKLGIVQWNPMEPMKAATTLHLVIDGQDPATLTSRDGLVISDFMRACNISVQQYAEVLPGAVIPEQAARHEHGSAEYEQAMADSTWDSSMRYLSLEGSAEGLQKLRELVGMPIRIYQHDRHQDGSNPPTFDREIA